MARPAGSKNKPIVKAPAQMPVVAAPSCLWDRAGMAEQVDSYWRNSPDEVGHRQRIAALVRRYGQHGTYSLLEVGCGTGLVYEMLEPLNLAYTGIDYSAAMLDIAKRRYFEGNFRMGNAEALDYPDGWFDVATAFEVFGHLDAIEKPIAELVRVANRTVIFTMWIGAVKHKGTDHYEYPCALVLAAIDKALGSQKATVTMENIGYVEAFVIEKVGQ